MAQAHTTRQDELLGQLSAVLDDLSELALEPSNGSAAIALVESAEQIRTRVDAFCCDVMAGVQDSRTFGLDGHTSAKTMVRHHADIAGASAHQRDRINSARAVLPVTAALFAKGTISTDKMAVLGKAWGNPRVRDHFGDADEWFADRAQALKYRDFQQVIDLWVEMTDSEGARDKAELNHARRDFHLSKVGADGNYAANGKFGSMQGAEIEEIFEAYVDAEYLTDWEAAKEIHGEETTLAHLARTPGQRRADAFARMAADAAAAEGSPTGPKHVHNIVWSAEAFQEALDAIQQERSPEFDLDTFRCETTDGVSVDPTEAAIDSLFSEVRRVVVDAKGVVIDLGRARLFTGGARHAAILQSTSCIWPGCHRPATQCEIDHLHDYANGGSTNPGNGAPLCGRHNRHKQKGFAVRRRPDGTLEILRPDGTPLE